MFKKIILIALFVLVLTSIVPLNACKQPDKKPVGSDTSTVIKPQEPTPLGGVDIDLITIANNCTYEFTNAENERVYYLKTEYSGYYTLNATPNEGYSISTVEYMGETYALPFTFKFTIDIYNPEKFYLNAEPISLT